MLAGLDLSVASPEARHSPLAFHAAQDRLSDDLLACASGLELVEAGFRDDVLVAAELDVSDVVPVLADGGFRDDSNRSQPNCCAPALTDRGKGGQ